MRPEHRPSPFQSTKAALAASSTSVRQDVSFVTLRSSHNPTSAWAAASFRDGSRSPAPADLCDDRRLIDRGSPGRVSVLRRLTPLLVLWAGLLGVGSQALACVTSAPADDCCPPGMPGPCGDPGTSGSMPTTICCVVAPTPASIVASNPCQSEAKRSFGSPDPLGPPMAAAQATSAFRRAIPSLSPFPLHADARLTYLRTGRLRL